MSQNGSTIAIDLLARTGIYGIDETNVNRKIIPRAQTCRLIPREQYPAQVKHLIADKHGFEPG
jgi:hypothetical protein